MASLVFSILSPAVLAMASSRSNLDGGKSEEKGVVNHYLNTVVAPLTTLSFKEGVLLLEEVKAPKIQGTLEERLQALEESTFRYGTVVERSLDAHHFMNLELEKKVEAYEERIKDLEEKYVHATSQLDKFQALMWDVENQNCEYEARFQEMSAAASFMILETKTSFLDGGPLP